VCIFEGAVVILTLLRATQAVRFGGGKLALSKGTLNYLVIEQGEQAAKAALLGNY